MNEYNENEKNPFYHISNMKKCFEKNIQHLRSDIEKIDEPQCKAMFETAAEVLEGLVKTFEDYQKKQEPAWK